MIWSGAGHEARPKQEQNLVFKMWKLGTKITVMITMKIPPMARKGRRENDGGVARA